MFLYWWEILFGLATAFVIGLTVGGLIIAGSVSRHFRRRLGLP